MVGERGINQTNTKSNAEASLSHTSPAYWTVGIDLPAAEQMLSCSAVEPTTAEALTTIFQYVNSCVPHAPLSAP
jgi:hypothetical protein